MRKYRFIIIAFLGLMCNLGNAQIREAGYKWHGYAPFYLSAGFTKSFWLEDLLPFGFKPDKESQIKIIQTNGLSVSERMPTSDQSVFSSVIYFFNDSVVQKTRLYPAKGSSIKKLEGTLNKALRTYFTHVDFSTVNETVYSDDDFLVSVNSKNDFLEISSLDHQQLVEQIISGTNLRNYKDDSRFWFNLSSGESIGLEFYNQITKENNVQLAFKLYYKAHRPLNYTAISFELPGRKRITFAASPVKEVDTEKTTRCLISVEVAKRIMKAGKVKLTLHGASLKTYVLPAYQKHSLKTALQFYKENVTNPLIKYNGW